LGSTDSGSIIIFSGSYIRYSSDLLCYQIPIKERRRTKLDPFSEVITNAFCDIVVIHGLIFIDKPKKYFCITLYFPLTYMYLHFTEYRLVPVFDK
jgi:hypothetical protein